jgi:hypothetical protein
MGLSGCFEESAVLFAVRIVVDGECKIEEKPSYFAPRIPILEYYICNKIFKGLAQKNQFPHATFTTHFTVT